MIYTMNGKPLMSYSKTTIKPAPTGVASVFTIYHDVIFLQNTIWREIKGLSAGVASSIKAKGQGHASVSILTGNDHELFIFFEDICVRNIDANISSNIFTMGLQLFYFVSVIDDELVADVESGEREIVWVSPLEC